MTTNHKPRPPKPLPGLTTLGPPAVKAYQATADWRRVVESRLAQHPKCLLCRCPATGVHALDHTLETLTGRASHRLVTLCAACLEDLHADGDRLRSLGEQNALIRKRALERQPGRTWAERYAAVEAQWQREQPRGRRR